MRIDADKLKLLHDTIDRQMDRKEEEIKGPANRIMFRRVHTGMMHAIIDMTIEHELNTDDIESAIGSAIANMVNSYLTGTISKLDIQTAKDTALEIMDDAWEGLNFLVDKVFVREATDADSIQ